MNLLPALLRREWIVNRDAWFDHATVAVFVAAFVPWPSSFQFLAVGAVVACSLGVRIGGDENMHGTWEFILTRPVSRSHWVRSRFDLGLLLLGGLLLWFLLADLVDLRERVAGLIADPIGARSVPWFEPLSYVWPVGAVMFFYAVTYAFAALERRPDRVRSQSANGFVFAVLWCGATMVWVTLAVQAPAQHWFTDRRLPLSAEPFLFLLAMSVSSWVCFRWARRDLSRQEVSGARMADAASLPRTMAIVAIATIALVVGLAFLMLMLRPINP